MRVIAAKADSYDFQTVEQGMNELLSGLGGLDQYIRPGDRVLLKPNLVEGMPPEKEVFQ